ncbi:bifunctional enoyl-CoA hydratase/phosphate acetyltransferase [Pseudochelatococcus contaminans]|uniref:Phosphotransacetylase n=1 Tax=Pseudochelatococcus contaminans TaxID=1538103 RepID=A0A7W5Z6N2_9HYPH|nr:bifunctional enoyl-CoA hydratase/phosphate acetyltransferase [Pseudochelatococcus contaminans]MBB3810677.1 phosphotransacetylase [Pseudochelatococcus contaminans]
MPTIANKTLEELRPGDTASSTRILQAADARAWANAFGDASLAAGEPAGQAPTGIITSVFAALVGTSLPGPGSQIRSLSLDVKDDLPAEGELVATLTVREVQPADKTALLDAKAVVGDKVIAEGTVLVTAPATSIKVDYADHRLDALLERARGLKPIPTAVVHPLSADALEGALDAAAAGLIVPVLFGPEADIRKLAADAKLDISGAKIVSTEDEADSAAKAALAAGKSEVGALMKGSLHTDVLLHAVLQKESNLRTGRLLSHAAVVSVPTYARRVIVTDVALNITPDTDQKADIVQNAIGLAIALGVEVPKVAVVAAVELVRTRMPTTVDAAVLAKMSDRRQIVGGIVDGPLDLDAAVDAEAAKIKHIVSPVAGQADIILVPNIDAGNLVYKNLVFMADSQTAGLVVGARVPIILTSRADTAVARRFSAAVAALYADALARNPEAILPTAAG